MSAGVSKRKSLHSAAAQGSLFLLQVRTNRLTSSVAWLVDGCPEVYDDNILRCGSADGKTGWITSANRNCDGQVIAPGTQETTVGIRVATDFCNAIDRRRRADDNSDRRSPSSRFS